MSTLKTVLFDFDGTLSTLRTGWEEVMAPYMKEVLKGNAELSQEEERALEKEISDYIDESTGIQTVYQMSWLAENVRRKGWNPKVLGEWDYKAEYNKRLLLQVNQKVYLLEQGRLRAEDFLMKGAVNFLNLLRERGIEMIVASGTDHPDVVREAEVLGIAGYFKQIVGAPLGKAECSKEKVIFDLMEAQSLSGRQLAVIGDGKVEIGLAKQRGAIAIGLASDEHNREGIDIQKQTRLEKAGADWITGDFLNTKQWVSALGL